MPADKPVTLYLYSRHAGDPVPVGVLETEPGYGRFAYHKKWLARPDAFPLDPRQLPLRDGEFETRRKEGVFKCMNDTGPDSWGKRLMFRRVGQSEVDQARILLWAGGYGTGCLQFSSSRFAPRKIRPAPEFLDFAQAQEGIDQLVAGEAVSEELLSLLHPGSSLGGERPKMVMRHDGREVIAKFPRQGDMIDIPRAEHTTLHLAAKAGIEVPHTELVVLPDGRSVLLVDRFDRQPDATIGNPPVHYISFNSLLGAERVKVRADGTSDNPNMSYAGMAWLMREWGSPTRKAEHDRAIFRRMIFNVLVSNTDDHQWNHGFLQGDDGLVLSPAFDIVPQVGNTSEHSLGIGPGGRQSSLQNAFSAAHRFGLGEQEARSIIEEVKETVAGWRAEMERNGVKPEHLRLLERCFKVEGPDRDVVSKPRRRLTMPGR